MPSALVELAPASGNAAAISNDPTIEPPDVLPDDIPLDPAPVDDPDEATVDDPEDAPEEAATDDPDEPEEPDDDPDPVTVTPRAAVPLAAVVPAEELKQHPAELMATRA